MQDGTKSILNAILKALLLMSLRQTLGIFGKQFF